MKKLLLLAMLAIGCTDDAATFHTLKVAGYQNVRLTGHAFFACAEDDLSCTGFEATGPTGVPVAGAVGCGLFKGCTLRIK